MTNKPAGTIQRRVAVWPAGDSEQRWLAEEIPVALCYNGLSHVVMMATPQYCEELAVGFSLSEAIVDTMADIYSVEQITSASGREVHLEISAASFQRLKQNRRHLAGRTGCGLCGRESLDNLDLACPPVAVSFRVSQQAIQGALAAFCQFQVLFQRTGAVHGAAWCNLDGEITLIMEDVGRHNALDKLIGHRARIADQSPGFLLISSRASYEIIQKSARAGIGMVVAVSAPTSLGVNMAEASGITLIGFARDGGFSVYCHGDKLV